MIPKLIREFVIKPGDIGKQIKVRLLDGLSDPIVLDGWTVQMLITPKNITGPATVTGSMIPLSDQVDNLDHRGWASYVFTSDDVTALTAGEYDMEFVAMDGDGNVQKYPELREVPFAKLYVLPTKVSA